MAKRPPRGRRTRPGAGRHHDDPDLPTSRLSTHFVAVTATPCHARWSKGA